MEEKNPHIGFEYIDKISPEFLDEFRKKIYKKELIHKEITRPSDTVFLSVDWLLPTAIILYITKSYFDIFLKEMAKDHYLVLKGSISSLANKSKQEINISIIASNERKIGDKIFTSSFSIMYEGGDLKTSFKFLFREGATEEQINEATNYFLDLLKEFNDNKEESKLNDMLSKLTRRSVPIIICYNENTKQAMILQPEKRVSLSEISS